MTWTLDTDKSRHFAGWGRFLTSLFCGRSLMLKQKPVGMSSTILLWLSAPMHMGKYKHTFKIGPTYGRYTRMLRRVLNTCWGDQGTNVELNGDLPTLLARIGFRRLDFASHCRRHRELSTSQLVLWRPTHGHLRAGCLHKTAAYAFKSHSRPVPLYPLPGLTITELLFYVFHVYC